MMIDLDLLIRSSIERVNSNLEELVVKELTNILHYRTDDWGRIQTIDNELIKKLEQNPEVIEHKQKFESLIIEKILKTKVDQKTINKITQLIIEKIIRDLKDEIVEELKTKNEYLDNLKEEIIKKTKNKIDIELKDFDRIKQ